MIPQDNDFRATLREAKALVHSPESLADAVRETSPSAALAAAKAAFDESISAGLNRHDLLALLASDKTPQHYEALILILADMGQDSPYKQVAYLRRLINEADHYENGPQIEVSLLSWEWRALELFLLLWCLAELKCEMPVVSLEEAHAILRRLPDRTHSPLSGEKNPAWEHETLKVSAEAWLRLAAYAPCHMQGFLFDRLDALEYQIFPTEAAQELARAMQYAVISKIRGRALFTALDICKYHDFELPPAD
jgi:hypothetical protein